MSSFLKIAGLLIVAAAGAFVLRALYIAASHPGPPKPAAMDRVRVAAADLPQGLLLRDSDLGWKEIPHRDVPPGALVQAQAHGEDLKGAVLRRATPAGKPLGLSDVITPDAPGFLAAALSPGMRAISVAVNDVSSNAGLIQPGDYVDVLLTQQLSGPGGKSAPPQRAVEAETVVNRVRVLAVGSAFRRPKSDAADTVSHAAEPNSSARTVTFEVTPRNAQVVAVASHLGTLSLALRSFATRDREPLPAQAPPQTPPVWAGDVSRALRSEDAPAGHGGIRQARTAQVIVYRGSTTSDAGSAPAASGAPSTAAAGASAPGPAPMPVPLPH
ncbi:hypothetical protein PATSB16_16460 [Pandoraea thiooxydans]|uniref:Pilus assembly protein CpaB n=1 Tax=Pandoraea thiooxydans TaxID=445709 RepID=A0A0U3VLU2_9BURK|nr:Flp pilus assembly protein CpaB [Pandoraea thiooxydans]ALX34877.1 Flp pilus assembly protein CpaB [Pandoraea thiooxydans]APR94988.1 hypothetical protein PATSB16_16460 [Pandoraea thiooxydans]